MQEEMTRRVRFSTQPSILEPVVTRMTPTLHISPDTLEPRPHARVLALPRPRPTPTHVLTLNALPFFLGSFSPITIWSSTLLTYGSKLTSLSLPSELSFRTPLKA